ncbi:DUF1697 domain-containing protein [Flavobacterium sp. W21_SRS_FM6]|uniref:DUF1697 domain-containing protein n=1 Tax=Flavobacterium sp. W21_SRS_FM6 TaxID=3240268 RepID=UPI003F93E999
MQTWVALLRGINVGGNNLVAMKTLCHIMTEAGYQDVKTYIQSGNVIFKHIATEGDKLAADLSALIQQHCGFYAKVMVFLAKDFSQIVASNPYSSLMTEAKQVHFFFVDEALTSADLSKLAPLKSPTEAYELTSHGLYLFAPQGIGRSKLVAKIDKCLGIDTTARNLNTLHKLAAMLAN